MRERGHYAVDINLVNFGNEKNKYYVINLGLLLGDFCIVYGDILYGEMLLPVSQKQLTARLPDKLVLFLITV